MSMITIFIALILLGTLITFGISIKVLNITFKSSIKTPLIYAYVFQIIGLIGLIFTSADFFNKNGDHLELTFVAGLPEFLNSTSAITWPFVVLICFLWGIPRIIDFLKTYRIDIPGLGIVIGTANQQTQTIADLDVTATPEYSSLTAYQRENVEVVNRQLSGLTGGAKENKLLIFSAITSAKVDHEVAYSAIFGSQLSLLMALKSNTLLDINSFYDQHVVKLKETLPSARIGTFDEWKTYLLKTHSLIRRGDDGYHITARGLDFLSYIEFRKYTINKTL